MSTGRASSRTTATGSVSESDRPYVVPESHVRMRGVSHGSDCSSRNVVTAVIA
jgi:hypothetical protein